MTELPLTNQDVYTAKAQRRKLLAKMPFELKVEIVVRMQRMNLEMKKAAGKANQASRPWDMSEEEFSQYLNE